MYINVRNEFIYKEVVHSFYIEILFHKIQKSEIQKLEINNQNTFKEPLFQYHQLAKLVFKEYYDRKFRN